ncbi:MAG TPA: hypothetical protein VG711_07610 [Phycisphaerales bacterium]|nr:hypothetical protein [Phycisphaerales bacterium]
MSSNVPVVFLVDPRRPGSDACAMARWVDAWRSMNSDDGCGPEAIVLGGRVERTEAEREGMLVLDNVPVRRSALMPGARRVAKAIERAASERQGSVIHALGWECAAMARALKSTIGLVASVEREPETKLVGWFARMATRSRRMTLLCEQEYGHAELIQTGRNDIHIEALQGWTVDAKRLIARDAVRREWIERGLIDDETVVIGVLGEAASCDAWVAANMGLRCMLAGMNARLVVHPDVRRLAHARGLSHEFKFGELFILDERVARPWELVCGLDAAMTPPLVSTTQRIIGDGPVPWVVSDSRGRVHHAKGEIAWCHEADTVVIVEEEMWLGPWLEEGLQAMFVESGEWNMACGLIMERFGHQGLNGVNGRMSKHSLTKDRDFETIKRAYIHAAGFAETRAG